MDSHQNLTYGIEWKDIPDQLQAHNDHQKTMPVVKHRKNQLKVVKEIRREPGVFDVRADQYQQKVDVLITPECTNAPRVQLLKIVQTMKEITKDMTQEDWVEFENAKRDASERIETVGRFSVNLEGLLKQVIVHPAQCKHLVQVCSTHIQEIKEIYSQLSGVQILRLYKSRRLRQLCSSLNNLHNSALIPVQTLLEVCGGKEWRRVALVLSLPVDQLKFSGSKFALLIRELGWILDSVKYALNLPKTPQVSTSLEELYVGEEINIFNTRVLNVTGDDGAEDLMFDWHDERFRNVLPR